MVDVQLEQMQNTMEKSPLAKENQGMAAKKSNHKKKGFLMPPPVFAAFKQLAHFYPHLFGATIKPLKRGIYQDIVAAYPDAFDPTFLKAALAHHTRTTRYLSVIADGLARFDLDDQAVETIAPEHVYYALQEVYRRRQKNGEGNLRSALIAQIIRLYDAAHLMRSNFEALLRNKNAEQNACLQEALDAIDQRAAKDKALQKAYQSSAGASLENFADMYGLHPEMVKLSLARASKLEATLSTIHSDI